MRIAVVSDTHFGDDLCTLVRPGPDGGPTAPGPGYAALRRVVGHADYLVLLGDVLDLSVASDEDAYGAAKAFFTALQRDGLAREIAPTRTSTSSPRRGRASSSPTATTSRPTGLSSASGRSVSPGTISRRSGPAS